MKHKVFGLIAVYGLYSAMGAFGIFLQAGEPTTLLVPPNQPGGINGLGKPGAQPGPPLGGIGKGGGIGPQFDLRGKKVVGIENGPVQVLANTTAAPTPQAKDGFINPKVEPGKVKWHPDFDTACKAATKSGKPVLLFQMMGKLDDQFC